MTKRKAGITYAGYQFKGLKDGLAKSQNLAFSVIPAKAGIQSRLGGMDPGFRRGDDLGDFLRGYLLRSLISGLSWLLYPEVLGDGPFFITWRKPYE